jgi:cell fate regulator YaaT (PSP1 superfamily)
MAELYLVEFKGSRKEYFYNSYHHTLKLDEYVVVQAEQGEDLGRLTKLIDQQVSFGGDNRPRSILRPAGAEDKRRRGDLARKELDCRKEFYQLIRKHGLPMKVVDVECQHDGNKITFFFTADHRVDFRTLVRDLASRFRTRIELRQIGVRDEARRNDGYGICGQRQCCNTFIREFAPISTSHAREQDLSLNPTKISGNCGRLLCCLRYEVDGYIENKKRFPPAGAIVTTKNGTGLVQRIDYFLEEMVCIPEDGEPFRAKADDLIKVDKLPSGKGAAPAAPAAGMEEPIGQEAKEELEHLDDLERM